MSQGQNSTAALTEAIEPSSPSPEDVEIVHRIVLRAQQNPHEDDRFSLITAYEEIFHEKGLDPEADNVCYWLVLEILKPEAEGNTLYQKFQSVLHQRGIVLEFSEDESGPPTFDIEVEGDVGIPHPVPPSGGGTGPRQDEQEPNTHHPASEEVQFTEPMDVTPPGVDLLMQMAIAIDRRTLIRASLQEFDEQQPRRDAQAMEQAADHSYELKLKYKVLTHWYNLQQQATSNYARAQQFHESHRRLGAFSKIFDSARVNRMQAMEEERLRGMGLYKLVVATREADFGRRHNTRLAQKSWQHMRGTLRSVSTNDHELENRFHERQLGSNLKFEQSALTSIYTSSQQHRILGESADEHYNLTLEKKTWAALTQRKDHAVEMEMTAKSVREFYLMRNSLAKIYHLSQEKRARCLALAPRCVRIWRQFVRRQKEMRYDALLRDFRTEYKRRLKTRCLEKLASKARDLQQLEQGATDYDKERLDHRAHSAIVTWYTRAHRMKSSAEQATNHAEETTTRRMVASIVAKGQQLDLLGRRADNIYDQRVEKIAASCLKTMGRKVFEIILRQQDADICRERHTRGRARRANKICLDKLRLYVAERRNERGEEGPLILPPATPAQRRAGQLDRLTSTTPSFPPQTPFTARLRGQQRVSGDLDEDADAEDNG